MSPLPFQKPALLESPDVAPDLTNALCKGLRACKGRNGTRREKNPSWKRPYKHHPVLHTGQACPLEQIYAALADLVVAAVSTRELQYCGEGNGLEVTVLVPLHQYDIGAQRLRSSEACTQRHLVISIPHSLHDAMAQKMEISDADFKSLTIVHVTLISTTS
jgi:hypothetical protein